MLMPHWENNQLALFRGVKNYLIESVMFNFMHPFGWATGFQINDQTLFWLFLWGYFWIRFVFKSVDLSKADCPPYCGRSSSSQISEQNKKMTLPEVRENSPADCLQTSSAPLTLPAWWPLNWKSALSGSPAWPVHSADFGLTSLIIAWGNSLQWLSYICKIHLYLHRTDSVSLEDPNAECGTSSKY